MTKAAEPAEQPVSGEGWAGRAIEGLVSVRAVGVATRPILEAADRFLTVSPAEGTTPFPTTSADWDDRMSIRSEGRGGHSLGSMTADQRDAAIGLIRASLAAGGLRSEEGIIKLNLILEHPELGGAIDRFEVLGQPSADGPWGWQLEGPHLLVNVFIAGDQVVVTPTFLGSEPTPGGLVFAPARTQP